MTNRIRLHFLSCNITTILLIQTGCVCTDLTYIYINPYILITPTAFSIFNDLVLFQTTIYTICVVMIILFLAVSSPHHLGQTSHLLILYSPRCKIRLFISHVVQQVFFFPLYVLQLQVIARNYSQASQEKSISSQQSANTSDAQKAVNKYWWFLTPHNSLCWGEVHLLMQNNGLNDFSSQNIGNTSRFLLLIHKIIRAISILHQKKNHITIFFHFFWI